MHELRSPLTNLFFFAVCQVRGFKPKNGLKSSFSKLLLRVFGHAIEPHFWGLEYKTITLSALVDFNSIKQGFFKVYWVTFMMTKMSTLSGKIEADFEDFDISPLLCKFWGQEHRKINLFDIPIVPQYAYKTKTGTPHYKCDVPYSLYTLLVGR